MVYTLCSGPNHEQRGAHIVPQYSRDPRWLRARFEGTCGECQAPIHTGDQIIWWPLDRKAYCGAPCRHQAILDFQAAAQDEAVLIGGRW